MVTKKTTRTSMRKHSNSNIDLAEKDLLDLPLLPIRNTVLLPNLVTPLIVGQEQSLKAIEEAMNKDRILFVVTQLNEDLEDPGQDDVYTVGVEGMVDRVLKMPDGTTSVLYTAKDVYAALNIHNKLLLCACVQKLWMKKQNAHSRLTL